MAEEQTNEQLKQALRNASLEIDELAEKVEVDIRTAYRWLTAGRTPYPRHRRRVADALGVPEQQLWPGETPGQDATDETPGDTVELLTADHTPDWRELLGDAQHHVELLDLTLADVITNPDDARLLAAAAKRGCRVRVLVSDLDSVHLPIAEQEAGRYVQLTDRPASAADIEHVVKLLAPHTRPGELELRKFVAAGCYRVLIFDDHALIRLRLTGVNPEAMPLLHLTRAHAHPAFESFSQHFDATWKTSETIN